MVEMPQKTNRKTHERADETTFASADSRTEKLAPSSNFSDKATDKETLHNTLNSYISDGTSDEVRKRYASLREASFNINFGEFEENIVVIDTETTGFSLNHDELIQIAAARFEKGKISDWYVSFVNPGKPIPENVAHLTDIHDEDVADAPSAQEALSELVYFVGDAKLVAHNADFDKSFTTKHPAGYPLLENIWIDSLDLARIALPRMKSHRLLDLVRAFGFPPSTHRADADVAATCSLFRVLLAAVDAMPTSLICQIACMANIEQWPTVVVFDYFARRKVQAALSESSAEKEAAFSLFKMRGKSIREKKVQAVEPDRAKAQAVEPDRAKAQTVVAGETAPHESVTGETLEQPSATGETASQQKAIGKTKAQPGAETISAPSIALTPFTSPTPPSTTLTTSMPPSIPTPPAKTKADARCIANDPERSLEFPSQEDVAQAFNKEGLVGQLYKDFEAREEQVEMSKAIRDAFVAEENLLVEAGTGVGKSMAYLVPAVLTARANNISVGVATKTNALLDQLIYHELPALRDALGSLTYASLKGFSHYPCLHRVERLVSAGAQIKEIAGKQCSQAPALAGLLSFIEQTEYDDIDSLKINYKVLPKRSITTTSNDCLRRKCPYFGKFCFVHGARQRAEEADIIVTNHSLLFCDIVADGGLLPPVRFWVIDEAHGTEAEARRAFSSELKAENINKLAVRVSSEEPNKNLFARAERRVVAAQKEENTTLFYALSSKARKAGQDFSQAAQNFTEHMKDLLFFDSSKRAKGYDFVDLWINTDIRESETFEKLVSFAKILSQAAEKLVLSSQEIVGYLEDVKGASVVQREIASEALELKEMLNSLEIIMEKAPDEYVYSAHLSHKKEYAGSSLCASLINVGAKLQETLYANTYSVIFTSATLTVNNTFDAFRTAIGADGTQDLRTRECKLESSYDYDKNMTIYVANDIPEPNDPAYLPALQNLLLSTHLAQKGSMLSLFTNRKEMEKCFDAVQPQLMEHKLRLVCQKWGVSVKGLRDDFLADEHLSLFALKSFWEGFDAPGATLKGVIITKLPFSRPTDPLSCERAQRDSAAWQHYSLPAAVLETKQAAGRLIRKADDTGVLILADRRLVTKGYGRVFLNSMPSKNIKICTMEEIAEELVHKKNG